MCALVLSPASWVALLHAEDVSPTEIAPSISPCCLYRWGIWGTGTNLQP